MISGLDTPRKGKQTPEGERGKTAADDSPSSFSPPPSESAFLFPSPPEASPGQPGDSLPIKLDRTGLTPHQTPGQGLFMRVPRQGVWHFERECLRDQVAKNLSETEFDDQAVALAGCHTQKTVQQCQGCKGVKIYFNHCDLRICPICQPRLAHQRQDEITWWTHQVGQPKHVVLTVRNTETLTKEYVRWFKESWNKLRRSKFARAWKGGMFSLEVTKESQGWHLHLHALIDAKWIDSSELAKLWASIVGQDFSIVKVKDCRGKDYLQEVAKYAVKGTDLAKWAKTDLVAFMRAFDGVRTFGTFGTLYRRKKEFKAWREEVLSEKNKCSCGCQTFKYFSEAEWTWETEVKGGHTPEVVQIAKPIIHPELPMDFHQFSGDNRAQAR